MSDKNFKVKNGIDAVGPITISPSSNSIDGLIINTPTGGKSVRFIRNGTGEVGSIDEWGGLVTSGGIQVAQPWYTRSPGIEAQSFFWAGSTTRSAAGFGGTNTGTSPVIYISSHGAGTNDLTQWLKPDNTILAKVDYLGSIYNSGLVEVGRTKTSDGSSAVNFITVGSYAGGGGQSTISRGSGYNGSLVLTNYGNGSIILNQGGTNILTITNTGSATFSSDLTVTGNFTVNGTTTNLNSTNLVVEDKNIIIADVTTPTDTTADGAGITIKGATDKTLNWVQSTSSFTSSDPFIINTNSTTIPNLILKQIASQTADLQQWQDSAGTVKASIRPSGGLSLNYANSIRLYNTANTDYAQLWMDNGSGGTNLYVKTNYPVLMGDIGVDTGASLTVATQSTGQVGQVIRAKASQTADLQQWQNSSGTVLSSISSNGNLVSNLSGTSTTFPIFVYTTSSLTTPYGIAVARQNRSDQYIHIHESDGSKAVIEAVAPNAAKPFFIKNKSNEALYLGTNDTNRFSITSTGLIGVGIDTPSSAQMTLINSNSANTGLLIKGAASQTADLQQWQDTSGTVLGSVVQTDSNNMVLRLPQIQGKSGGYPWISFGSSITNTANQATDKPLVVKGASSQSANLTEWQNSAGTVLSYVRNDGLIYSPYLQGNRIFAYAINSDWANYSMTSTASSATSIPLGIRGAASQTANLQEWQNSAGTALASVSATGTIYAYETANSDALNIYQGSGARRLVFGLGGLSTTSTFTSGSISWSGVAQTEINSGTASRVGLLVKGAASQTANLQEWQNSSGTVLAKIDKDGIITVPAINVVGQSISSNTTMIAGYRYFVDTSASRTLTLPSSATIGDEIQIFDSTNTAGTNNITINSNNGKIEGVVESYIIDVNGAAIVMTYTGSTYGWKVRM